MWDMLPGKKQLGSRWEPALPLILAAWWEASPDEKRQRFQQHLQYAAEHGILDKVGEFLRNLHENEWFHESE